MSDGGVRFKPAVIVHYHELSLKRGNRPLFLRHLQRNLHAATADTGGRVALRQLSGRIVLDVTGHPAPTSVRDRVARVFGVASCALAYRVPSTLESMQAAVGELIAGREFPSFRISARRAFKTFPLSSVATVPLTPTGSPPGPDVRSTYTKVSAGITSTWTVKAG